HSPGSVGGKGAGASTSWLEGLAFGVRCPAGTDGGLSTSSSACGGDSRTLSSNMAAAPKRQRARGPINETKPFRFFICSTAPGVNRNETVSFYLQAGQICIN